MTDLSPALISALHEIAIRKRSQALPDEALCRELAERGLAMKCPSARVFRQGVAKVHVYVVTREGDEVLKRWRNGKR